MSDYWFVKSVNLIGQTTLLATLDSRIMLILYHIYNTDSMIMPILYHIYNTDSMIMPILYHIYNTDSRIMPILYHIYNTDRRIMPILSFWLLSYSASKLQIMLAIY